MHKIKIFRRHNIDAFTGSDSGAPGEQRYQYTKRNGEVVKCEHLAQFMHENDADHFLGWHTKDILEAFPLCRYDSVEQALNDFGFEWHQSIAHLIVETDYRLIDPQSLQCTVEFQSDNEYNTFNIAVKENILAHGFKEYKLGIFYEGA